MAFPPNVSNEHKAPGRACLPARPSAPNTPSTKGVAGRPQPVGRPCGVRNVAPFRKTARTCDGLTARPTARALAPLSAHSTAPPTGALAPPTDRPPGHHDTPHGRAKRLRSATSPPSRLNWRGGALPRQRAHGVKGGRRREPLMRTHPTCRAPVYKATQARKLTHVWRSKLES